MARASGCATSGSPRAVALVVPHNFQAALAGWRTSAIIVAHGGTENGNCQRSDTMLAPWAKEEMASVDFGDERLDARVVTVLSALGCRPNVSIPAACGGRAEMQAAYRFFDNDKVTFEKTLEPHVERSRQRVAQQKTALLVQDTSEIDVTRPEQEVKG